MKMMDKENGILWHFVAQHKISIKLITLKIYAASCTRPEVKFEMAPNLTKLAPHELIWCFYTSVWSALIILIWTFFFVAAYYSQVQYYTNPTIGALLIISKLCTIEEYHIKQKFSKISKILKYHLKWNDVFRLRITKAD